MFYTNKIPLVPPQGANGLPWSRRPMERSHVVAMGGGHGLSATLSALRLIVRDLTAVVTVADDGGSSGRIREELDVLPPGDLRMALAALCDDTDWGRTWRDVMQHRFKSNPDSPATLDNHALGNLLIVTLWELLGNPVDGLRWAGALLGARGQVLPVCCQPLVLEGDILSEREDGALYRRTVTGQVKLAEAARTGAVSNVRLIPNDVPVTREVLEAVDLADWIILGPGSWYTSVLPHLLLPQMRHALATTTARKAVVMNLKTDTHETAGMGAADHLRVLSTYAPDLKLDVILADPDVVSDHAEFVAAAQALGAEVKYFRVHSQHDPSVHDPLRLANAFQDMFDRFSTDTIHPPHIQKD